MGFARLGFRDQELPFNVLVDSLGISFCWEVETPRNGLHGRFFFVQYGSMHAKDETLDGTLQDGFFDWPPIIVSLWKLKKLAGS